MTSLNFKNILAIGAHPDDIEFGCYGFLLKQADLGASISVYVATLGSKGDPSSGPIRKSESEKAFGPLKLKHGFFREQNGLSSADFDETLDSLSAFVQKVQPDLILTLSAHDTHQEHRLVHELTLAAARRSHASIFSFSILSNTLDFAPRLFIDVEHQMPLKREALKAHVSQREKYYMSDEYFEIFHSHNYACLHGVRYSEAYEIVRLLA